MSAFTVSEKHIQSIMMYAKTSEITSYYYGGESRMIAGREKELGQLLWDANYHSVNSLYDIKETAPKYHVPFRTFETFPVQIIKACNCLDYQSCEFDEWKTSEAYALLQTIREEAIQNIPGYNKADWEIY